MILMFDIDLPLPETLMRVKQRTSHEFIWRHHVQTSDSTWYKDGAKGLSVECHTKKPQELGRTKFIVIVMDEKHCLAQLTLVIRTVTCVTLCAVMCFCDRYKWY